MKKIAFISSLIAGLYMMTSCGVQMLPMALDTAEDNDPYYKINGTKNSDYVELFTASSIFLDDLPGCWGFEKDACRDFMVDSKIVYKGMGSLHLKWDKSKKGCDWIGVGFMWNNWQTVDMSDIIDTWALEFWVRTADGDEIGFYLVPAVATLMEKNVVIFHALHCCDGKLASGVGAHLFGDAGFGFGKRQGVNKIRFGNGFLRTSLKGAVIFHFTFKVGCHK